MSLLKLASDLHSRRYDAKMAYDDMINDANSHTTGPYGKSALIGLGLGGAIGLLGHKKIPSVLLGGLGGSLLGLGLAGTIHDGRANTYAAVNDPDYSKKSKEYRTLNDYIANQSFEDERQRAFVRRYYESD